MARFSSVQQLSPDGTNISGATTSNALKTEAATDARIYLDVATVPGGGAILDVFVQASADNVDFADILAFNQISATGKFVLAVKQEELGTFTRLRYVPSSGTFILGATLEKKQGV